MRGVRLAAAAVFVFAACRFLDVSEPPGPPGPGTLQATLVYQEPGRSTLLPAVGASVELLGTSVSVEVTEANGHFTLAPITTHSGRVLIRFDTNKDGTPEYQRIIALDDVKAGPGR